MNRQAAALAALILCQAPLAYGADVEPNDPAAARIEFADQAVAVHLVLKTAAHQGAVARPARGYSGADAAEIGIAVLAGRSSSKYATALARLSRYRFDAGLSVAYGCALAEEPAAAIAAFSRLSVAHEVAECNRLVARAITRMGLRGDVDFVSSVCESEESLRTEIQRELDALSTEAPCPL